MPPTVPPTSWTAWYNVDDPTDGTDDETHAAVNAVHPAVCPTPTQADCRVRFLNTDHVTAGQTLVTGCSPTGGLLCQDADQTDSRRCLDYEIRFQCPTPEDALPEPHFHWDMSTKTSVDSDEPVTCDGTVSSIYPTAGGMTGIIGGTLLVTDSFDSSDHLCAVRNQKAGWINYGSGNDRCISEPVCCTSGFTMTFWMRNRTPAFTPVTIIIATGGHAGRARGLVLYLGDFMSFDVRGFVTSQVFKLNIKGYFPDDQWTHHSFTYEPGVGTNYYKDGVFVVSTDTAVNEGTSALHFDDVVMFSRNNDPSGWPLELIDGDFSNFKMFYKTFNETEVQNAYLQETSESKLLIHYLRKHSHEDSFGVELECLAKAGSQPTIVWHRSVDGAHFEPVSSSADVAIYESSPNSYRRRSILVARDLSFSSDVIFVCEAVDTARRGSVSKRVTIPKRDSYWTPWLSADSPADGDDRETLIQHQQGYEMLCQYPEDIQCRTVYEGTPSNETGQLLSINCTLTSGLVCLGADQSVDNTRTCYDYEVRYQCPQPSFRLTPWYDASDPDGSMEDETLATHLKQAYPDLCSQPVGAECRLKTTKQDLLASGFVPEVPYLCNANGFRCQHADNTGSCPDFEVRYRCPDSIVTDVTVNLRPLHSPNDTVVRLECSATGGQPISADLRLEWAWLDLAHPWAAAVLTAGAAVDVVVDSSRPDLKSSLLTIVDFLCSDYSDKTIVCLVRDGITIVVKTIQPLAKPPVPVLLEFWELSGEPNLDHQDPTSCSSVSNHSFPSTESDRKSQAVGRVTYIDAPAVVGHACAVLSGTDSALDLGAFDGECISSLELCSCGLTFALWVMAFDPGPLTFDWFFLSSGGWSSSSHGIAFYQSATDHSYRLKVCTSTKCFGEAIVANNQVPKGSWFHLALVFDHKLGLQLFYKGM
ncbi:uncharacterized protein LOC110978922 [Acanthaster planci]|uniref:Uncharacterized protein LOC110978922 n=1 Tax=Acanthaster planci TaxID=133434 RepID=A0A8B7YBN5_ACAPL|nr:uncharacterized protein LOC110978922 [Acanthaster planci]